MKLPLRKRQWYWSLLSGLGRRFMLYFLFFSILPIAAISIVGFKISENLLIQHQLKYLELQNELIANRLASYFQKAEFEISPANPRNQPVFQWIRESLRLPLPPNCPELQTISSYLREIQKSSDFFSTIFLTDSTGTIVCSSTPQVTSLHKEAAKKVVKSSTSPVIITASVSPNPVSFFVKAALSGNHQNRFFLVGLLNLENIRETLNYFRTKWYSGQIAIFDDQKELVLTTWADSVNQAIFFANNLRKTRGVTTLPGKRRVLYHLFYYPVKHWYFVSTVNYQEALHGLIIFRSQAILGVVVLLVLLTGLAFYASQRLVVPIRQLVYAAQDIGDGLLHSPIRIHSRDEIGLLAKELDEMRQKLLDYYENLEKMVEERTRDLQKAQFQIMHQEKMASIGLLAAGIAHEIGNPLTSISSLTQLLKRRLKDPDNLEYLSNIMKNIDRISRIVRELVDFSRPSNYESRYTNVNEVLEAAVGIARYDSRSKFIEFHLELDPNLPPVYLVADQLLQVFINIIFNAVDAMEGYGKNLYVKTFVQDDQIFIQIRDTGCGIPESEINKIFEPFYTTKEVGKGTGLGLSVSYGIIRNFNGDITVESKVGEGSTFTIKLPIKQEGEEK